MNILKSMHNYLCRNLNINTYEYSLLTIMTIALHDLLN